jgi:hypothetical protein
MRVSKLDLLEKLSQWRTKDRLSVLGMEEQRIGKQNRPIMGREN